MGFRSFPLLTIFLLFINYAPSFAQGDSSIYVNRFGMGNSSIGLVYGTGASQMDLKEINNRLNELEIGEIQDLLANFYYGLHWETNNGFTVSLDGFWSFAPLSEKFKNNSKLNFKTFAFGAGMHQPIIYAKNIGLWVTAGYRFSNLKFEYNSDINSQANFNDLLTNGTTKPSSFGLNSSLNDLASFGARFQYRIVGKEKKTPWDFRVGFFSEYNYCIKQNPWRENGSSTIISNMPKVSPDNFVFSLTLSLFFANNTFSGTK